MPILLQNAGGEKDKMGARKLKMTEPIIRSFGHQAVVYSLLSACPEIQKIAKILLDFCHRMIYNVEIKVIFRNKKKCNFSTKI